MVKVCLSNSKERVWTAFVHDEDADDLGKLGWSNAP